MLRYETVLFDLDGTLTDPQTGITRSVQYALRHMGITEPDLKKLIHFIGPPLVSSFRESYGMDEKQAKEAVRYYREYFSETGIFENAVYPGIFDLLTNLRHAGAILAVATSKPGVFAKRILDHFELSGFFYFVAGSNLDGSRVEKSEVIQYAMGNLPSAGVLPVVMVGDRKHDIIGARANRIDSIAVGYGYGSKEELDKAEPTYFMNSVEELMQFLR